MNRMKADIKRDRETKIIAVARHLVKEKGILTLRISDLAKAVGISVGTLYTHFATKEDLIVVLATKSWQGRFAVMSHLLTDETWKNAERIITLVFSDFLFSLDHPELFAAEQLAVTPSVWPNASDFRRNNLLEAHTKIVKLISYSAKTAIAKGEFVSWDDPDRQAAAIDKGVWTIMVGSSYIWFGEQTMQDRYGEIKIQIPTSLIQNTQALFQGFGWICDEPAKTVEAIADDSIINGRYAKVHQSTVEFP